MIACQTAGTASKKTDKWKRSWGKNVKIRKEGNQCSNTSTEERIKNRWKTGNLRLGSNRETQWLKKKGNKNGITLRSVKVTKPLACISYQKISLGRKWVREAKRVLRQEWGAHQHLAGISTFIAKIPFDVFQFEVTASSYPAPAALLIWGLLQTVMCSLELKLPFRIMMSAALLVRQDIAFAM